MRQLLFCPTLFFVVAINIGCQPTQTPEDHGRIAECCNQCKANFVGIEEDKLCGTDKKNYSTCDFECKGECASGTAIAASVDAWPGECQTDGSPQPNAPERPADGDNICGHILVDGEYKLLSCIDDLDDHPLEEWRRLSERVQISGLQAQTQPLPRKVDHSARWSGVWDQGCAGTCTAFGLSSALESGIAQIIGDKVELSKMQVWGLYRSPNAQAALDAVQLGGVVTDAKAREMCNLPYDCNLASEWMIQDPKNPPSKKPDAECMARLADEGRFEVLGYDILSRPAIFTCSNGADGSANCDDKSAASAQPLLPTSTQDDEAKCQALSNAAMKFWAESTSQKIQKNLEAASEPQVFPGFASKVFRVNQIKVDGVKNSDWTKVNVQKDGVSSCHWLLSQQKTFHVTANGQYAVNDDGTNLKDIQIETDYIINFVAMPQSYFPFFYAGQDPAYTLRPDGRVVLLAYGGQKKRPACSDADQCLRQRQILSYMDQTIPKKIQNLVGGELLDTVDIDALQRALFEGADLYAAFKLLGPQWSQATKTGGVIADYDFASANSGHAVTIAGYEYKTDETGRERLYFRIRNSWSEAWGDKGYGYLSADAVRKTLSLAIKIIVRRSKPADQECPANTAPGLDNCIDICPKNFLENDDGTCPAESECEDGQVPDSVGVCVSGCEAHQGATVDDDIGGNSWTLNPNTSGCSGESCNLFCPAPRCYPVVRTENGKTEIGCDSKEI